MVVPYSLEPQKLKWTEFWHCKAIHCPSSPKLPWDFWTPQLRYWERQKMAPNRKKQHKQSSHSCYIEKDTLVELASLRINALPLQIDQVVCTDIHMYVSSLNVHLILWFSYWNCNPWLGICYMSSHINCHYDEYILQICLKYDNSDKSVFSCKYNKVTEPKLLCLHILFFFWSVHRILLSTLLETCLYISGK